MDAGHPFKRQSNLSGKGLQQKQVFAAVKSNPEEELPECFFHPDNRIIKFCECKDCTLPLCQICEQIHLEEHEKTKVKPMISSYVTVRDRALRELPVLIRKLKHIKEATHQTLLHSYEQIIQAIRSYFEQLSKDIDSITISEQKLLQLDQRSDKISKGSIKSLIQHYSDNYSQPKMPKLNTNFSSPVLVSTLKSIISLSDQAAEAKLPNQYYGKYQSSSKQPIQLNRHSDYIQNQIKRIEHSPKPVYKTLQEEDTASFMGVTNVEWQHSQQADKTNGDKKLQASPVKNINITGRKTTIDSAGLNGLNKNKYEEFRDSFRKNTLVSASSLNRSNAASLEGKEWKKVIINIGNQNSASSLMNMQNTGQTIKKDLQSPDQQRSPSYSNIANPKGLSIQPHPAKQYTHEQIKQMIRRDDMGKEARNRSVEIKQDSVIKTDISDRFGTTKPSTDLPAEQQFPKYKYEYPNIVNQRSEQTTLSNIITSSQPSGSENPLSVRSRQLAYNSKKLESLGATIKSGRTKDESRPDHPEYRYTTKQLTNYVTQDKQ